MLYVTDSGDPKGAGAAVYRVTPLGLVSIVLDAKTLPGLTRPTALAMDGASHLLVADAASGDLYRVKLADGSAEKIADGLGAVAGLAWDHHGRLFVSDGDAGRLLVIAAARRQARRRGEGPSDAGRHLPRSFRQATPRPRPQGRAR